MSQQLKYTNGVSFGAEIFNSDLTIGQFVEIEKTLKSLLRCTTFSELIYSLPIPSVKRAISGYYSSLTADPFFVTKSK